MRALILHSDVPPDAPLDDLDTLVQAEAIEKVLQAQGVACFRLPFLVDLEKTKRDIKAIAPDVIFNLLESVDCDCALAQGLTAVLEHLRYPFTGSPVTALVTTTDKVFAKEWMRASQIPTADWITPEGICEGQAIPRGKLILKSRTEHASVGLDDASIVENLGPEALLRELNRRKETLGGQWFAESFISGREFNLSVLEDANGPRVLTPAEILFTDFPDDKPKMVGYKAKWEDESFEYKNTVRAFPFAPSDQPLLDTMSRIALHAFRKFNVGGYGRVDFRVSPEGIPYVLEINANPCLSPDAGFAAAANQEGMSYDDLIMSVVATAIRKKESASLILPSTPKKNTSAAVNLRFDNCLTPALRAPIARMVEESGFFSPAELAIALELVDDVLAKGTSSDYRFLLAWQGEQLVGYTCYGAVAGAVGTFDLYWIVVDPRLQGRSIGKRLNAATEEAIRREGGKRVLAETSGRDQYKPTQRFYEATGYTLCARIPNYYDFGDDNLIYMKDI